MSEDPIRQVPISELRQEDGAHELATSPDMQPYLAVAKAVIVGADATSELDAIRQLPLSKRYVWRVASALKWAFADFDDLSVTVDKDTLNHDELKELLDLLRLRSMQFCLFLQALVGAEEMQRVMAEAIAVATQTQD